MAKSYYTQKKKENDARLQRLNHYNRDDTIDETNHQFIEHLEADEENKKLNLKGKIINRNLIFKVK